MDETPSSQMSSTAQRDEEPVGLVWTRADYGAALFLSLLPGVFFIDVLFGSGRFYVRDLTRFYYPVKLTIARIIQSGEFPWWNPFYAAGQPIAANPEYAVFYPPQWLILLPDFDLGFRLHILVHLTIALLSMYILLRSLRLTIVPAIYGAIAWGLGGILLSSLNLLPILFVISWMPLFLFALRRSLQMETAGAVALAGVIGGIQILAGEPTSLIQTWILGFAFVLWWLLAQSSAKDRARSLLIVAAVFTLAIAIGAVQLFPAMDHARDTVRGRGLGVDLITHWSFPPLRTVELVQPFFFGFHNADGRVIWWGSDLYPRASSPFIMNLFSGALVLPLLVAGFLVKTSRRWAFLVIAVPFLILSMGGRLPWFEWMVEHGIALPIRFPEKLVMGAVFASIVYASFVLDRALSGDDRVLRAAFVVAATMSGVLTAGWIVMSVGGGATAFLESLNLAPVLVTESARNLVTRGWMLSSAFMVCGTAILFGIRRGRGAWQYLLIAMICAEMLVLSVDLAPRIGKELFAPPAALANLPDDANDWRLFHEADWYENRFFTNGDQAYWELVNGLYPLTPGAWGYSTVLQRDYDLTQLLPTVDIAEAMWRAREAGQEEWRQIFMNMSNARVRLSLADAPPPEVVFSYPWLIEPVAIEDIGLVPRYYFASEVRRVSGLDQFVETVTSAVPPSRAAFVTEIESFDPAEGAVVDVHETSSSVDLAVVARGRSFLVLSNTDHKYWKATIDGDPARIVRTNIGYQGIVVDQGEHRVELEYSNPIIKVVAPLSAAAVLLALLLLSFPAVGSRRLLRSLDGSR